MPIRPVTSLGNGRYDSPLPLAVADEPSIPSTIAWSGGAPPSDPDLFEKAGPRARLFFDPRQARAAIVTAGGLCPGLNNVIRSLFLELHHGYGVSDVTGFLDGFRGLDPARARPPIPLTVAAVKDIHRFGGTMLGTSRGPVDIEVATDHLIERGIDMLFCVGGDGTQRGAAALHDEAGARGYPLAVVGVPKTIDNDVPFVTRTFGFTTAVEEARTVITCAHTEARSVVNGVTVVKLMGRHAGFIAAAATVASQDVNFCLIPEVPFVLDGENGLLALLERRLEARRHAVVVVAEGAGQELIPGETGLKDVSGNVRLQDIGPFLCDRITAHFASRPIEMTLRYFDPSYQIRSCAANTEDAVLCDRFARHAVHAAMAGKTALIIGLLHGQFVHVPTRLLASLEKRVRPDSELWHAVLSATGQPDMMERSPAARLPRPGDRREEL